MYVHCLISKMYFKKYNFNELTWTVQKTKKKQKNFVLSSLKSHSLWLPLYIYIKFPWFTFVWKECKECEDCSVHRNLPWELGTLELWRLWSMLDLIYSEINAWSHLFRDQCLISSIRRSMLDLIYSFIFKLSVFDILHDNRTKLRVEGSFDSGRNN